MDTDIHVHISVNKDIENKRLIFTVTKSKYADTKESNHNNTYVVFYISYSIYDTQVGCNIINISKMETIKSMGLPMHSIDDIQDNIKDCLGYIGFVYRWVHDVPHSLGKGYSYDYWVDMSIDNPIDYIMDIIVKVMNNRYTTLDMTDY